MERYLAICHPLQTYTMDKPQRPIIIMFIAWSIALVSAVPFAIYTNVNYVEYPPGTECFNEVILPYTKGNTE